MASLEQQLEEAMADLAAHTRRVQEMQAELATVTGSATSRGRLVSATVDSGGRLTDLKFHTEEFRTLPPAQLADLVKSTVNEARDAVTAKVGKSVRPLVGEQGDLAQGLFGGSGIEDLLAPLRAMRPDGLAAGLLGETAPAGRSAARRRDEEEFDA
ncbi:MULTISPECIES: YbaB/EbfC family nucleoid-associated protein [unclassified Streptomyces]|uniref:YbaB/EbfC family nucleoid-associated protein n=1 Tax=Streptomyces sp. NBC_00060 TaxID=2975636 RepID=A0AAU2H980_9ACTN